jgi:hypothetical protein
MQRALMAPPGMGAIGLQQVVERRRIDHAGDDLEALRLAPGDEVAAELGQRHELGARFLHRLQALQLEGQGRGQLRTGGLALGLRLRSGRRDFR